MTVKMDVVVIDDELCYMFRCFRVDGYSVKSAVDIAGEVCSVSEFFLL